MARLERSIDVDVPARAACRQWSRYEEFPRFMVGVRAVRQRDDPITSSEADREIAWRSIDGVRHHGSISFEAVAVDRTRVTLRLDYEPRGLAALLAGIPGLVHASIGGELRRFKEFSEKRERSSARAEQQRLDLERLRAFIATRGRREDAPLRDDPLVESPRPADFR